MSGERIETERDERGAHRVAKQWGGQSYAVSPHADPHALKARVVAERFGFLTDRDVEQLARHPEARLWLVVVRCGACRFHAATQDVQHISDALTAAGDYVRDVSFPAQT